MRIIIKFLKILALAASVEVGFLTLNSTCLLAVEPETQLPVSTTVTSSAQDGVAQALFCNLNLAGLLLLMVSVNYQISLHKGVT